MDIQFFAYLRNQAYAGCKGLSLEGPATLRALGNELSRRFGKTFHDEFFNSDETELGEKIIVIINGRRAEFIGGLDATLCPEDTVLIFPVVAGG